MRRSFDVEHIATAYCRIGRDIAAGFVRLKDREEYLAFLTAEVMYGDRRSPYLQDLPAERDSSLRRPLWGPAELWRTAA